MNPSLDIGSLSVDIPIEPSSKAAQRRGEMEKLHLEIYSGWLQIWGEGWGGDHYDFGPKRRSFGGDISQLPHLDLVFGFLAEQRAAHRLGHIGAFLVPILTAMELAIAARDGSSVYFAGSGGQIKIGWSRKVSARLAQLQTGSPIPIKLLGTMPGGRAVERRLHEKFAHLRISGEWFTDAPELLAFIAEQRLADVIPIDSWRTA